MLSEESVNNAIEKNSREYACCLLAENLDQQKYLQILLQAHHLPVHPFASGRELLAAVSAGTQVIIVAATGYDVDYSALFAALQQKAAAAAIIALSADNSRVCLQYLLSCGAAVAVGEIDDLLAAASRLGNPKNTPVFASTHFVELEKEAIQKVKEDPKLFDRTLSRRTFLKGSAAAAALTGITLASPGNTLMEALAVGETPAAAAGDKIYHGVCRCACFSGCRMKITVRDGKVVATAAGEIPDPEYTRICAKGLSHSQRIYDANRLKYPMKRVGERGSGQWERISWDEAIDTIADKWQATQAQFGKASLGFMITAISLLGQGAAGRLQSLLNGTTFTSSYDWAYMYTAPLYMGDRSTCETKNLKYAKTVIIWGANVTEAQPQDWHFIMDAKQDNGAKLIVIDPNFTAAAAKADVFIPIRPGTDAVLAMAMINVIVEENLIDRNFLQTLTVAPFLVKAADGKYLRLSDLRPLAEGEKDDIVVRAADGSVDLPAHIAEPVLNGTFTVNGIQVTTAYDLLLQAVAQYTPEKAEEICGVKASQIAELARLYATNGPAAICHSYGPNQYYNGHTAYFATAALAMVTGQAGKKGTSWGEARCVGGQINSAGMQNPTPSAKPSFTIPLSLLPDILTSGKFNGKDLNIKTLYVAGTNPMGNLPQRRDLLKVLDQLELIVVADMSITDTAHYADIILPAAHWFELEDVYTFGSKNPYAIYQEKCTEPLYESKPDFEIYQRLAQKLDLGQYFTSPEALLEICLDVPAAASLGLSYKALKEKKIMRSLPEGLYLTGNASIPFNTATKRAQFYLEDPKPRVDYGQKVDLNKERLPHWYEPLEANPDNPLKEKYPLICFQEHAKWRVHTQWSHVQWLKELDPEPIVKLNGADAADRGIKDGDKVKVFNDRGYVIVKARINNGLRPGIANIPHGWQGNQFIEGHYQDLSPGFLHPFTASAIFFDSLVEVQKV